MVGRARWPLTPRRLVVFAGAPLLIAFVGPGFAAAVLPAVSPAVSFGDQRVIATGMTPKGQVVWFGVMRDPDNGTLDWAHHEEITTDQSGMGTVELNLGKPVAPQSIWFAVDLATGQFAVNAPTGYPLRQFDLPGGAIPAALDHLVIPRSLLIAVIVRPGVGAWTIRAGDGAAGDSDGAADGKVDVDLTRLLPIGATSGALKAVSPKDTLLIVDQARMDFIAVALH
jgi:hypothetical protein